MLDEEDFGIVLEVDNLRFPLMVAHTAILTNAEQFSLKSLGLLETRYLSRQRPWKATPTTTPGAGAIRRSPLSQSVQHVVDDAPEPGNLLS